jgi:hypothetical protein
VLVGPAVVLDDVAELTVGERGDGHDGALVPLVELGLTLDSLPEYLDSRSDGGVYRCDRLLGRRHSRRVLGRKEHERRRRG